MTQTEDINWVQKWITVPTIQGSNGGTGLSSSHSHLEHPVTPGILDFGLDPTGQIHWGQMGCVGTQLQVWQPFPS